MRLRGCAWLALSSLLLSSLAAATRPRYGGMLTVELVSGWSTLDPSESVADAMAQSQREAILPLVAETLVRLNAKGEAEACLAINWQHDADRKRWRFSLRPKLVFQDGEPLTPTIALAVLHAALKKKYGEVMISAGSQTIVIQSENPMPDLLTRLSDPSAAIFRTSDKSPLIGTGPFRIIGWDAGHRLTLAAFEDYWGGRPYLDSVTLTMGAPLRGADIFALPVGPSRRVLPERTRIWSSASRDLIAIVGVNVHPVIWQALEFSIDRAPIVNVLAQRRGETAFSLLPQWLSGYAFLFRGAPDTARAKALMGQTRSTPLSLSYSSSDGFARLVAERVALNARDAGLSIEPAASANGNLRLVRIPLESTDAVADLFKVADLIGFADRPATLNANKPETLYDYERLLLDTHKVIPLVYLPDVYGVSPRVHDWEKAQQNQAFTLHLENVWVDP